MMVKSGRFIDTPDRLKIFYPFITAVLNHAIMERLILIDMSPVLSIDLFLIYVYPKAHTQTSPDSNHQPQIKARMGILGIQYASAWCRCRLVCPTIPSTKM